MPITWDYYFQFTVNKLYGISTFSDPFELFMLIVFLIAFIFLLGIINALYKDYKKNKIIETFLFLLGMILLIPSNIFLILISLCYSTFGLPELGAFLTLIALFPSQITYLCVNIFAIRVTFPKRYKVVLVILLILSAATVGAQAWAIIVGSPYSRLINFSMVYSFEVQIIRYIGLVPIAVIPISVFYYYAIKVREENKARSSRSIWLGTGILFFALAVLIASVAGEFRIFQVLYLPAAIIFYVCFSMPDWFKRRIGWTE
ncbi:MAG: hypothetical protein ACFFCM_08135 [Promethearchaeota archaeon]